MSAVRNYAIVTSAYFPFTITDGAIRMLVLLHFYKLGYTPFMLAFLFLLYETAGIFANVGGGWLASRFGIPRMLASGLVLQIAGLCMLSALDPSWSAAASVAWVVAAQGIAGVAKDLTKTASKSAIKATSQEGAGQLFRWVAWFTGSKNATKGVGLFHRRLPAAGGRLPSGAVADGGVLAVVLVGVVVIAAPHAWQGEGVEELPRAVRQDARDQPDGSRTHLPVRLARRLVRRRPAGVPLRLRLEVHAGRGLRRGLDHRLWRGSGAGARRW